jgi:hypothetical protein
MNVNKVMSDVYKGTVYKGGKEMHRFDRVCLPALAGHLMTIFELYDDFLPAKDEPKKKGKDKEKPEAEPAQALDRALSGRLGELITRMVLASQTPAHTPAINITINNGEAKADPKKVEVKKEETSPQVPTPTPAQWQSNMGAACHQSAAAHHLNPTTVSCPALADMESIQTQAAKLGPGTHNLVGGVPVGKEEPSAAASAKPAQPPKAPAAPAAAAAAPPAPPAPPAPAKTAPAAPAPRAPAAIGKSFALDDDDLAATCPDCGENEFDEAGNYAGCPCFSYMNKSSVSVEDIGGKKLIKFGKAWSRENIEAFLRNLRAWRDGME